MTRPGGGKGGGPATRRPYYQSGLPLSLTGLPAGPGAGDLRADAALAEARSLLERAVELMRDEGGEADPERGLELLEQAAATGHLGAIALRGRVLLSSRGHEAEGLELLCQAAEAGDAGALHLIGLALFHGHGVEVDHVEARRLQQLAAEAGDPEAQLELSLLLAEGIGGPVDEDGAAEWERRAAEAGHPRT